MANIKQAVKVVTAKVKKLESALSRLDKALEAVSEVREELAAASAQLQEAHEPANDGKAKAKIPARVGDEDE